MGLIDVLVLILIVLKVAGLIACSWWLVFSPWLITLCLALIAAGLTVFLEDK